MTKTKSLLQKAKSLKTTTTKCSITDEQIELAVAWARDEISYAQVQEVVTGRRGGMTAYVFLARALREHLKRNKPHTPLRTGDTK